MRAFAVLAVVFYHLDKRLVPGGFIGVDVFFVISGFVVSLSMAKASVGSFAAFTTVFYSRRLLRIAPALVVCLLITSLASNLFIPRAWLSDANWKTGVAAFFGVSNFLLAAPSNAYFSPRAEFNPFTHTWSLAVEEQFYLLFPLLFYAFRSGTAPGRQRRFSMWALGLLCVLSLVFCAWWTHSRPTLAFYLIPSRFWELAAGMATYLAWGRWFPVLQRLRLATVRTIFIVALLGLVACAGFADETVFPFPWAIPPVLLSALLIAISVARRDDLMPASAVPAPLLWLGMVSYSLYLWHWPVFVLCRWTVGMDSIVWRAFAVMLSMGLAGLSYRWIESPIRDSSRIRKVPRWQVVILGLACVTTASAASWQLSVNEKTLSMSVTSDTVKWLPDSDIATPGIVHDKCALLFNWQALATGSELTRTPNGCERQAGRLYVAGDSHAWAYTAMLRMYAANSGHETHVMRAEGCPIIDLAIPMAKREPACADFARHVFVALESTAQPGDVLFLPSLRVPRLADQWGGQNSMKNLTVAERQPAIAEAIPALRRLADRGMTIVLEAPKPVFPSPPFRCSDWFNSMNPVCAGGFQLKRSEFEASRASVMAAMEAVVKQVPNAVIWDPANILCTKDTCNAYLRGQPMFFDGDHLSGIGNAVLYPDFDSEIRRHIR